jgi:hypothetical protein
MREHLGHIEVRRHNRTTTFEIAKWTTEPSLAKPPPISAPDQLPACIVAPTIVIVLISAELPVYPAPILAPCRRLCVVTFPPMIAMVATLEGPRSLGNGHRLGRSDGPGNAKNERVPAAVSKREAGCDERGKREINGVLRVRRMLVVVKLAEDEETRVVITDLDRCADCELEIV